MASCEKFVSESNLVGFWEKSKGLKRKEVITCLLLKAQFLCISKINLHKRGFTYQIYNLRLLIHLGLCVS